MMLFQRRLFLELMGNTLIASVLLITVLMLVASVQVVSKFEGIGLTSFITSVPIFAASALDIVLPLSVLIAVVMTYGRAAGDNEIDTLRASGVNPWHLLTPGLIFGLLMTAALMLCMDYGKPYAERSKRRLTEHVDMSDVVEQKLASGEPLSIDENTVISANGYDDQGMAKDVRIQVLDDDGAVVEETLSASANVFVDEKSGELVMQLFDVHRVIGDRLQGTNLVLRRSLGRSLVDLGIDSWTTPQLQAWLLRDEDRRARFTEISVSSNVHRRRASAASCLVFVFLGLPVALRFRRSDRVGAFLVAFLLALFVYFPVVRIGKTLARGETLSPMVAAWIGPVLILLISLLFSRKVFSR
ncbi:MAG: lipopolysaccharide export system permease protein [Pseudohongiellaceae bacterium]|jgi:lipopolysaccharide export system permease protein